MKYNNPSFILVILILLVLPKFAFTADTIHYQINKTSIVPVIDGKMDELWHMAPEINDFQYILDHDWETVPDDTLDASPKFRLLWDDTYLYVYAETYDDILHKDGLQWHQEQSRGYNDDCFELFFDGNNSRGDWDGLDDTEMWFLVEESEVHFYTAETCPINRSNIVSAQSIWKNMQGEKTGWSIEVQIPLDDLNILPNNGYIFSLDLKYSDDDGRQLSDKNWMPGADREHNIRWSDNVDFHPPSTWNEVQLLENSTPTKLNSETKHTTINYDHASGNITITSNTALLNNTLLIYNSTGFLVFNKTLNSNTNNVSLNSGLYIWKLNQTSGKILIP